jgi:hypothetical protein
MCSWRCTHEELLCSGIVVGPLARDGAENGYRLKQASEINPAYLTERRVLQRKQTANEKAFLSTRSTLLPS